MFRAAISCFSCFHSKTLLKSVGESAIEVLDGLNFKDCLQRATGDAQSPYHLMLLMFQTS